MRRRIFSATSGSPIIRSIASDSADVRSSNNSRFFKWPTSVRSLHIYVHTHKHTYAPTDPHRHPPTRPHPHHIDTLTHTCLSFLSHLNSGVGLGRYYSRIALRNSPDTQPWNTYTHTHSLTHLLTALESFTTSSHKHTHIHSLSQLRPTHSLQPSISPPHPSPPA